MTGQITKLLYEKNFGFIRGSDEQEYFFHRSDITTHWDDLDSDMRNTIIQVEFTPDKTEKGLRAYEVRVT
jgi:cold shock CspA family protein